MYFGAGRRTVIFIGAVGAALMLAYPGAASAATTPGPPGSMPGCGPTSTTTDGTTFSTTTFDQSVPTSATLPDLTATATRVEGVVSQGSTGTVVYDQTVSPGGSTQNATLFASAAAADSQAAPGSAVAAPVLLSTSTSTSTPVLVSSVDGTPTTTADTTSTIGPATVDVGPNGEFACPVIDGAELINTVVTTVTPVTNNFQSTATTTTTYAVDATVAAAGAISAPAVAPPTSPGAAGTLAFTGVNEEPIVLLGGTLLLSGMGLTVLSARRRPRQKPSGIERTG
jgi:hypothetical protein